MDKDLIQMITAMHGDIGDIKGAIGEIRGAIAGIKDNQKETRAAIVELFRIHRECPGPGAADDLENLKKEIEKKRSLPPAARAGFDTKTIQLFLAVLLALLAAVGVAERVL